MKAPMLQIKARQPAAWVALYQSETYFIIFIVKVGVVFTVARTCSITVCLFPWAERTPGIRTLLVTSADPKFMRAHAQ